MWVNMLLCVKGEISFWKCYYLFGPLEGSYFISVHSFCFFFLISSEDTQLEIKTQSLTSSFDLLTHIPLSEMKRIVWHWLPVDRYWCFCLIQDKWCGFHISWTPVLCHTCKPLLRAVSVYLTILIYHQGQFPWWLGCVSKGPVHWGPLTPPGRYSCISMSPLTFDEGHLYWCGPEVRLFSIRTIS